MIHWWVIFRSADDLYQKEVNNSLADLGFGIIYIGLLEFVTLYSREFEYVTVMWFVFGFFLVDFFWALLWRFVGRWKNKEKVRLMEAELNISLKIDILMVLLMFGSQ